MPLTDEDIRFMTSTAKRMLIDKHGYPPSSIPPIVIYREFFRLIAKRCAQECEGYARANDFAQSDYYGSKAMKVNAAKDCAAAILALIPEDKP